MQNTNLFVYYAVKHIIVPRPENLVFYFAYVSLLIQKRQAVRFYQLFAFAKKSQNLTACLVIHSFQTQSPAQIPLF